MQFTFYNVEVSINVVPQSIMLNGHFERVLYKTIIFCQSFNTIWILFLNKQHNLYIFESSIFEALNKCIVLFCILKNETKHF